MAILGWIVLAMFVGLIVYEIYDSNRTIKELERFIEETKENEE